jgi:HD-GYP domain-containing protein (c-di-GMP phosphodiesterase class II)
MLRQIRGVEPVVIQAVEQHHERRSRKGFPYRLGSGNINRVSEIIGISDEFVHLIGKCKVDGSDPFKLMESTVFHGFSSPVITAFQMIFMNRHQA